jgi:ankyrin repeat protein
MLAALLLALVAVPAVLLWRSWAADAARDAPVKRLIDLAIHDPTAAILLLRDHPELLQARYLHDETPLHYCAVEGSADAVRLLARAGMPVDAVNQYGDTALVDAVARGNLDVARLLLYHGADPNAASRRHGPALHIAVARGHAALAAALLDAGARADYVTGGGARVWDAVPKAGPGRTAVLELLETRGLRP